MAIVVSVKAGMDIGRIEACHRIQPTYIIRLKCHCISHYFHFLEQLNIHSNKTKHFNYAGAYGIRVWKHLKEELAWPIDM